ncbi:MAG: glycosyltransferase family 4 protein [Candidatus Babeliales bacterium]|jgi:glycosyltransferase involved in cell wall biosynthesis
MNIVVSAGGRFHAHHLAHQLALRHSLRQFFTFDYTAQDTNIPEQFVHVAHISKLLNDSFVKLQAGRFFNTSRFNVFKDNLFDKHVSKRLEALAPFDLFIGWAHYAAHSIPAARRAGAKVIIESGSCHIAAQQRILHEEYRRWGIAYAPIDQRTIEKMCTEYHTADYIMTLSSFARQSFIDQGISPQKVLMVPCGVDTKYFSHDMMTPPQKQKFRVIVVGLVSLRKGIQNLLQAWDKLNVPKHESELLIVGALTKDFTSIAPRLRISANVIFTGPVDRQKLRTLYQQASLFVLPSLEDGFGMVIGEAMASGLPVICSTASAGPELITDNIHGFLIQPGDIAGLAEKIEWCYRHQAEAVEMGMQGQPRIQSFSWNTYGNKIYQAYADVLKAIS